MKKKMVFKFTLDNPDVEKRKNECEKIINQFPDKIPIICEKDPECREIADIDKTKYLVSSNLTVAQFSFMIRKKLNVKEGEKAFYLLVNGKYNLTGDIPLSKVYENHKNPEDGFLYIVYTGAIFMGNK